MQYKSVVYHPESQGALERFHQTIKTTRTYCYMYQYHKDWDEDALFTASGVFWIQAPFKLVFRHRGPKTSAVNLLGHFKERLYNDYKLAQENPKSSQAKMKVCYGKEAMNRIFKPGDKVLVFLSVGGHPLQAIYDDPYKIESKDTRSAQK